MQVTARSADILNFVDVYPLVFVVFIYKQKARHHDQQLYG